MALLNPQTMSRAGLAPAYGAVAASDTIAPVVGSLLFLQVKNGNAAADTVTLVDAGKTPAGSSATNPTVVVPATTGDRMIGPLLSTMADPVTGLITVQHSVTATVTCALVQVPLG
ncbi:MAG: hypothetical protein HY830_14025 [Actinobacteria bacterium]|nr:hypothetical protein [Actinomycetota bacterium]